MAVGNEHMSVTERLEQRGREAGQQSFQRHVLKAQQRPDLLTRWSQRIQNSMRRKPIKWTLVTVGLSCIVVSAVIDS
jgi:hypothetical protein